MDDGDDAEGDDDVAAVVADGDDEGDGADDGEQKDDDDRTFEEYERDALDGDMDAQYKLAEMYVTVRCVYLIITATRHRDIYFSIDIVQVMVLQLIDCLPSNG
jgi:hypothetical protein